MIGLLINCGKPSARAGLGYVQASEPVASVLPRVAIGFVWRGPVWRKCNALMRIVICWAAQDDWF